MYKNTSSGLTLVELLTVIAIIGILATVTLASFSGAREKARDDSAKAGMQSILVEAALYKSKKGNYTGFCSQTDTTDSDFVNVKAKIESATGNTLTCTATASAFGATIKLVRQISGADAYYCVDSTKFYGDRTTSGLADTATAPHCPSS